jgi:hypothetical protein
MGKLHHDALLTHRALRVRSIVEIYKEIFECDIGTNGTVDVDVLKEKLKERDLPHEFFTISEEVEWFLSQLRLLGARVQNAEDICSVSWTTIHRVYETRIVQVQQRQDAVLAGK